MYLCVILQCTLYPKERVLYKEKYLKKNIQLLQQILAAVFVE